MSNLDVAVQEAKRSVDRIHERAKRSANASIAHYNGAQAAERKQKLLKDIERHAPGWAAARERWAAEAERERQRQEFAGHIRAAAAGTPLTDEQMTAIRLFIDSQEE